MNEDRSSCSIKVISKLGYDMIFTVRDESDSAVLRRVGELIAKLEELHCRPTGMAMEAIVTHLPEVTVSKEEVETMMVPGLAAQAATIDESTKHPALTFEAKSLVGSMNKGKVYWKVLGGKFSKYGVAIYPEALKESGIDPDKMDPSKIYDINMTAHYTLNEEGKPYKVTLLTHN